MMFPMKGKFRRVGGAFVADSATLTGEVTLADEATVWFGAVLRGDDAPLRVGRCTNIQDLTMMHADPGVENVLGDFVTVGHRVVLHGTHVEDDCLIGMGAILLGGSRIGRGSIVAAGCVVKEGAEIPPFSLVVGVPGKVVRQVDEAQIEEFRYHARKYHEKALLYLADEEPGR